MGKRTRGGVDGEERGSRLAGPVQASHRALLRSWILGYRRGCLSNPSRELSNWLAWVHKCKNRRTAVFTFVHPEGFEPPITVPKTVVISISPWVQSRFIIHELQNNQTFYIMLALPVMCLFAHS